MGVQLLPLEGIPAVRPGDDLPRLLADAIERSAGGGERGDVLVVCQKIVSKAEGRVVDLRGVRPSPFAVQIAEGGDKDARVVEVILSESRRIVRMDQGHLIVETHHGFVCANAGVDESNSVDADTVILLPRDPDASAAHVRRELHDRYGREVAVIVSDTFGRPWREGLIEVAIGVAGLKPLLDLRGGRDLTGRELHHTVVAVADELAGAAGLLMEKGSGVPAVIVRGYEYPTGDGGGAELVREPGKDLFR